MKRSRKAKRAAVKPAAPIAMQLALKRLERAVALLSCLEFAATAEAELDLGPVAFVARDLVGDAMLKLQALATAGGVP